MIFIAVDLSPKCVEHCKQRYSIDGHVEFHVNDGRSLSMVSDDSIDFAFSFDSLVHAEEDVLEAYLKELSKKLGPGGTGFIHHSNMGAYPARLSLFGYYNRLPSSVQAYRSFHASKFSATLGISMKFSSSLQNEQQNWHSRRLNHSQGPAEEPGSNPKMWSRT